MQICCGIQAKCFTAADTLFSLENQSLVRMDDCKKGSNTFLGMPSYIYDQCMLMTPVSRFAV